MLQNIHKRTLDIASRPGRAIVTPFARHYEKHYEGRYPFARLAFGFDLVMLGTAIGLGIIALAFWLWKPTAFAEKIVFSADIAPAEIVSGAPSTLVLRFDNRTGEELRDVRLSVSVPEHFLRLETEESGSDETWEHLEIGTVPVDGTESIKIHGVMFGDVGGEQTFASAMTFVHGPHDTRGTKRDERTFVPTRSTLELELALPDRMVAGQATEGTVTYRNAGTIDFPEIVIQPRWPEGFAFISANVPLGPDGFRLPSVTAGSSGALTFRGTLGSAEGDVAFAFDPSFAFGNDRYRQETLVHVAKTVPIPVQVSHDVNPESVRPGSAASVTATVVNVGEDPVTNVRVTIASDSPFAISKTVSVGPKEHPELARLEPGESRSVTIPFPLRASVAQSATSVYERIPFATRASAAFDLPATPDAIARDAEISTIMTSPLALDAFARYAAPSGDQIGRGPLPPFAGETTTYWIFWNVRGTTNELSNVRIEGALGPNVSFTGKQTVSVNGGVVFDAASGQISWTSDSVSPTFAPSSKIVGIAFELALTPGDDQIGSIPTLLKNIHVTATDAVTGAFVSASGATITTDLPNDTLAEGNGVVE